MLSTHFLQKNKKMFKILIRIKNILLINIILVNLKYPAL